MILIPPALQSPEPIKPLPFRALRAEYKWSIRRAKESGGGTLTLLIEPATGKLVLEVFSYGDRLALVDGDASAGYQVVLPKEQVNRTVPGLADLPLPFLPQAGSVEALARALAFGEGSGVTVEKRDDLGPVKLGYQGLSEDGSAMEVHLIRKRWAPSN